jgi:hypothetical protein
MLMIPPGGLQTQNHPLPEEFLIKRPRRAILPAEELSMNLVSNHCPCPISPKRRALEPIPSSGKFPSIHLSRSPLFPRNPFSRTPAFAKATTDKPVRPPALSTAFTPEANAQHPES